MGPRSRKRKFRGGSKSRPMKRRRVSRRSVITQTNRQLNGTNPFAFRSRKLRKTAYRRALWNETRFKTHFRSTLAFSDLLGTPNNINQLSAYCVSALSNVSGSEFWHTTGGLQDPSFGEVPSWAPSVSEAADPLTVIIRGGRFFCTLSLPNASPIDTCKVRVQLIFAKQQPRNVFDGAISNTLGATGVAGGYIGTTGINLNGPGYGLGTSRFFGWSLEQAPDFEQYFLPPVLDRSFDLKAGDSMSVFKKIKPVKIDVGPFKDGGCYCPFWLVYVSQDNNNDGVSETVSICYGHSLSFSVSDTLQ